MLVLNKVLIFSLAKMFHFDLQAQLHENMRKCSYNHEFRNADFLDTWY